MAGNLIQEVKDGKLVENAAAKQKKETDAANNNQFDKDMFLQLLVAEMKYQDPLEPTNNTEYVSELASFSQIEATQNVQDKMDDMSANNLVGKYVIIDTTNSKGEQMYVSGKVDYVEKKDDGYYLSVNDGLYKMDQLDTVTDQDYYEASMISGSFSSMIKNLPSVQGATLQDEKKIAEARTIFDSLTPYQKQFIKEDDFNKLESLEKRIASLKESDKSAE